MNARRRAAPRAHGAHGVTLLHDADMTPMDTVRHEGGFGLALLFALARLACGGADVGEACDDIGKTDECVDGAVCTKEGEGDGAACRAGP